MKKALSSLLALCILLLALAVPAAAAEQGTGKIYLYGETHANQSHLDQELAAWKDYYQNQGMRDLFIEVPSYSAAFLNLWMKAGDDAILTRLYEDWSGTAMDSQATWNFYQAIKAECPETVFHGFDVGHQYNTTGTRYLIGLMLTGQMGSADWDLAQKSIDQGKTYYKTSDQVYRENQMAANLREAFDALPAGTSVMVITGSAHSDIYQNDMTTGTVPCMANQLRQVYGENLIARNLFMGFDYGQAGAASTVSIGGKDYPALCLALQDLSGTLLTQYQSRTFWLVQDAYADVQALPATGDFLPQDNYPCPIETGQVFAVDYALTDGSSIRLFYRADGSLYQNKPNTLGFLAG